MFSRTLPRRAGFIFRENRVPYYQRLFQKNDGKRLWNKSHRSPYLLYPYYISLFGTFGGMLSPIFVARPLLSNERLR
ncbi:hypothetical protein EMCG_00834 [[Emmonsia] crescens]|uniref:Cytochrome c oxidase subunit VIIc n=1 Tax=[Emmonsia] crescens TaxID=73230 RepID=A0A0G2HPJ4_9EURO|nr:hypothetical protein EMCG_00834 [Emmonsia crescens UAMH 3008]